MVDFTKSINNEQMVEALNNLIRHNREVGGACRTARDEVESDTASQLAKLEQMHERHTERLGESVRLLGGAPSGDDHEPSFAHKVKSAVSGLGNSTSGLKGVLHSEDQLTEDYVKTVDQYRASDEIVAVVNQLLDESKPLREWLKREVGKA